MAHPLFKLSFDISPVSTCKLKAQSAQAEVFREAKLIVRDKAVMQYRYCFDAVDSMLRDIRESDRPFGGIVMLFAGTCLSNGLQVETRR